MKASPTNSIDPFNLLRTLEEISHDHARTLRSLGRSLNRLKNDPSNNDIQLLVLSHIRRLRVLRSKLHNLLLSSTAIRGEPNLIADIATLSEYFLLVGFELERDLLKRAKKLGEEGARLISSEAINIRDDIKEIEEMQKSLEGVLLKLS